VSAPPARHWNSRDGTRSCGAVTLFLTHYRGSSEVLKPDTIPLSDGAGEVVLTGSDVQRWKVGDRVVGIFMPGWISGPATATKVGATVDGVLAEYVLFDEQAVVSVSAHLDFAEAATLPCAAVTAWHAVVERGALH